MGYSWRDFDEEVLRAFAKQDPEHLARGASGGMTCPLRTHDRERLSWIDGDFKKGTVTHGTPELSFRVSPTYVLTDARQNFIVGRSLIDQVLGGNWGKAETYRLGNENSEDALTWNVFRSLQETERLKVLTPLLCECTDASEAELYLWGRRITAVGAEAWKRLAEVRAELEPTHRQQTEPDAVLHLAGWGWIFIEAKFGSKVTTAASAERMRAWLGRYPKQAPHLFNLAELEAISHKEFPEQLLRNIVFADRIAAEGERAHVVLLAREKELTSVDRWLRRCLAADGRVSFSRLSWEQLYRALPVERALAPLRRYLEEKSYALGRAFDL